MEFKLYLALATGYFAFIALVLIKLTLWLQPEVLNLLGGTAPIISWILAFVAAVILAKISVALIVGLGSLVVFFGLLVFGRKNGNFNH